MQDGSRIELPFQGRSTSVVGFRQEDPTALDAFVPHECGTLDRQGAGAAPPRARTTRAVRAGMTCPRRRMTRHAVVGDTPARAATARTVDSERLRWTVMVMD